MSVELKAVSYRKKPIVIKAFQVTQNAVFNYVMDGVIMPFEISPTSLSYHPERRELHSWRIYIETLEGRMEVSENDYVIKGVKGEIYPCKPDIFEATYDRADLCTPTISPEVLGRVMAALEWYAEPQRYRLYNPITDEFAVGAHLFGTADRDRGRKAAEALRLIEHGENGV